MRHVGASSWVSTIGPNATTDMSRIIVRFLDAELAAQPRQVSGNELVVGLASAMADGFDTQAW